MANGLGQPLPILASSNYFSTRLQTALQYPKGKDAWGNLLGTMQESSLPETDARRELAKWQPVRRHSREFDGLKFQDNSFQLFAQVFARDLYQFGHGPVTAASERRSIIEIMARPKGFEPLTPDS